MPQHKITRPSRYSAEARDWTYEKRLARVMAQVDFLEFEVPSDMPEPLIEKMIYDFGQNRVEDTERNRVVWLETQQLGQELREHGIVPEQVSPTRDGRGYVRLGFDDVFKLLDLIEDSKEGKTNA
jgi:hypothetical protein